MPTLIQGQWMMKRGGMVAAILLLGAQLLTGCSESEGNRPKATEVVRPVKTVILEMGGEQTTWNFPGSVQALRDVELSFRVGGPVMMLTVDRGQTVKKGEFIARIDPRDFQVAVATSKADLAMANAQLKEAVRQYNRYKTLSAQSAASQATFDGIIASYEVARARVDVAKKRLEEAENSLADTTLLAPFDGYVHQKYIDNLETVPMGQPVVSLVDLDRMEVVVAIPEARLSIIREVSRVVCRFDSLPSLEASATVKELSKNPNASNRSYPLYLTLEVNEGHKIRPGMASEVTLISMRHKPGFFVPETAVVNTVAHGTFVWVVDGETMVTRQVPVELLGVTPYGLRIGGSLEPGMRVVTAGLQGLSEGHRVCLLPEPSATNVGGEL